jgi:hypothetical protein
MSHAFGVDLKFVVVEWHDAWKDATNDVDLEGAQMGHLATTCFTAGWMLVDDKTGIQLCAEASPTESLPYRQRTLIPRAMIVAVHPQRLSKKRTKKNETSDNDSAVDRPGGAAA